MSSTVRSVGDERLMGLSGGGAAAPLMTGHWSLVNVAACTCAFTGAPFKEKGMGDTCGEEWLDDALLSYLLDQKPESVGR